MHKILAVIIIGLIAWISPAEGAWVESQGKARIINDDIAAARKQAVEQAIHYATLKSGVNFTSVQHVTNGQLTQSQYSMDQNGQAGAVELVSEQIKQDQIFVTLRIDVFSDTAQRCQSDAVKAAILVPQASIQDISQVSHGRLSDFGKDISARLSQTINQMSLVAFARDHSEERLELTRNLRDIQGYRLPSWFSETTDSQYVLIPEIIDISTDKPNSQFLGLWQDDPFRQFALRLSIYHGISGEQIWHKNYQSQAPWEFNRQQKVFTNTNKFWRSQYGIMIDRLIAEASTDIDNILNCRPLMGQVVARKNDRVIINLGRKNGIKIGDKFSIVLQQNVADRFSQMRTVANPGDTAITIDQVTEASATAILPSKSAGSNIQLNDIALKI